MLQELLETKQSWHMWSGHDIGFFLTCLNSDADTNNGTTSNKFKVVINLVTPVITVVANVV